MKPRIVAVAVVDTCVTLSCIFGICDRKDSQSFGCFFVCLFVCLYNLERGTVQTARAMAMAPESKNVQMGPTVDRNA